MAVDLSEVAMSKSSTELAGSADTRPICNGGIGDETRSATAKVFTLKIDVNQARSALAADIVL